MTAPSRLAATKVLHAVFGQGSRVRQDWDAGLSGEDSALGQAMLGLVLRRWGRLQAWITPRLREPERGLPLGSRIPLALGLAQLAWLDGVAAYAAVHESVELVMLPGQGFPPHRGLVNALLRRASEDRDSLRRELEALPEDLDRSPFAEQLLAAAAGTDPTRRAALWSKLQRIPAPAFRLLQGELPPGLEPDPAIPGCLLRAEDAPFPVEWLRAGRGMVQDRSSQALMAFQVEAEPARILDACAAPGGKTTSLALRFPGAKLVAVERSPRRARRLEENLRARSVHAEIQVAEAGGWMRAHPRSFDLVLIDAPCSGSGTLSKHPELTWIGGHIDLEELRAQQEDLIDAALEALAPGGMLIYAVCSWLPQEGLAHRQRLAQERPGLVPLQAWPADLAPAGVFRPDPLEWDGEGFQAFALGLA